MNLITLTDDYDLLQYPFAREKQTNYFHDIKTDGKLYKSLMEPGNFHSVSEHLVFAVVC